MENDLISRANLLKTINEKPKSEGNLRAAQLLDAILTAPSVEAEPVRHGQWYKPTGMVPAAHSGKHRCSACGYMALYETPGRECLSDYCPSCGAKMDAKEDAL